MVEKFKEKKPRKMKNFYKRDVNEARVKFKELTEGILTRKNTKILIVEDNKEYRTKLIEQIKSIAKDKITDKERILTETLEQAKKAIQNNLNIELIITDVSYPEKEGMQETPEAGCSLIRYVKETRPGITIIAQSSDIDYLENAKNSGADFIITKTELVTLLSTEKEKETKTNISKQKHILIVTSFPQTAASLKRGIQTFIENAEVETCKWKEFEKKFSPGKYTHIIVFPMFLSDEYDDVKRAYNEEEAIMLEKQGYTPDREMPSSLLTHRYCWKDDDVKRILINLDDKDIKNHKIGVYERYNSEKKTVAYLRLSLIHI